MEPDVSLRRVERTSVAVCLLSAVVAFAATRGRASAALSVLGGGALIGVTYWMLKGAATTLAGAAAGGVREVRSRRAQIAVTALKLAARYALLAFLAYVMIARLRLHPLGLLVGASSVVAAVSVEAIRLLKTKSQD